MSKQVSPDPRTPRFFPFSTAKGKNLAGLLLVLCFSFFARAEAKKKLLGPGDFIYRGVIRMPSGIGQYAEGLAYRRSSNTYFTIGFAGLPPYRLFEIELSQPSNTIASAKNNRAKIIKDWGPLNIAGRLNIKGDLLKMKGLYYDESSDRLWFSFGSFYAALRNNSAIGYATLNAVTGKVSVYGPWGVNPSIHSDTVKGMIEEAPPALQAITGNRFIMFGVRGSNAQYQSWGAGLVSVAEPSSQLAPYAEVEANRLIHWPMRVYGQILGSYPAFSDFPRLTGDEAITIVGNDNVSRSFSGVAREGNSSTMTLHANVDFSPARGGFPNNSLAGGVYYLTNEDTKEQLLISRWDNVTKVATVSENWRFGNPKPGTKYSVYLASYENNVLIPPDGKYRATDSLTHATWIDLPNKHGLLYFGATARGYSWYGNPLAHSDPTTNGSTRKNHLSSMLDPSQLIRSVSTARGGHTESLAPRFYIFDPETILANARKAKAHQLTAEKQKLRWETAGDVMHLGTGPTDRVQLHSASFGDMNFDPKSGVLSVLCPGGVNDSTAINVWDIKPD